MTELPYRTEHVADSVNDTEHMTNEELGAFVRLQRALWNAGGFLPEKQITRYARAGKRWGHIGPVILEKLTFARGVFSCARVLDLLNRTRDRRAKIVERGTAGAKARWAKQAGSEGHRSAISAGNRNPEKSNQNNESFMLEALVMHSLGHGNQNPKNLESKSLSAGVAAAMDSREGIDEAVYREGERILMERANMRRLPARVRVGKWIAAAGTSVAVAALLRSVEAENLYGAPLLRVIDQRIDAIGAERSRGTPLPFGFTPNVVKRDA